MSEKTYSNEDFEKIKLLLNVNINNVEIRG